MAESAYPQFAIEEASEAPRHSLSVRVTHWITALSFLALLVSGVAILISHPRFYWGETGNVGTPSLFDLPIPFVLKNQNGWGRYLHFLGAWIAVLTGAAYALYGVFTGHFRMNLFPTRAASGSAHSYNTLQRLAYSGVVFGLFPLAIWTGLAMSPAITSVFPPLVTVLGGQQSARTIHFFVSVLLVAFVAGHIVMVFLAGFRSRVGAMITGGTAASKEDA